MYTQPNAEFQRIARRDKKVFFNEHCKEIDENNRDVFKKTRNQRNISSKDRHNEGQKW